MTWKIARTITAAAALFGAAACVSTGNDTPPAPDLIEPSALLEPYYTALARQTSLPSVPGPELNTEITVTRFGFGSCNHHGRSQDIWAPIMAADPQFFMMIGDNVYGDTGYRGDADLASFEAAYRQQAGHEEFLKFRAAMPMLATWDDHDFGPNDSGGAFFGKLWSEHLFETFWGSSAEVRSRPGVYDSRIIGSTDGQKLQIIVLDTRFFRTDLAELPYSEERRPLGNYVPTNEPAADMLGAQQWAWLEEELSKPADLRVVVSSIQVLTDAHRFESWALMPQQRMKFLRVLERRDDSGLLLLSGDRHSAAFYRHQPAGMSEEIREFTSSSLNLAFVSDDADEREPDPRRDGSMYTDENFGLVDIDWASRRVRMQLMDDDGTLVSERSFVF